MSSVRTFADLVALHGAQENRRYEFKRQPIRTDTLVEHIQAAANGEEESVTIILGAAAQHGVFDKRALYPIRYPFRPGNKKPEIRSFDDYKRHLYDMARELTDSYFEKLFSIYEIAIEGGSIFVIDVPKSAHGPHQNKQRGHFPIKADGHIRWMTAAELRRALVDSANAQANDDPLSAMLSSVSAQSTQLPRMTDEMLKPGALISRHHPETGDDDEVRLGGKAYFVLKLSPDSRTWRKEPTEILTKMRARRDLLPLLYLNAPWNMSNRNDHGAAAWLANDDDRSLACDAIQIDHCGELSAYDARLLDPDAREQIVDGRSYKILYAGGVEQSLEEVLQAYVQFATEVLGLPLPLRGSVGLHNVEGYRLATDHTARMTQSGIFGLFTVGATPVVTRDLLRPYYEQIWLACGRQRPMDFRESKEA